MKMAGFYALALNLLVYSFHPRTLTEIKMKQIMMYAMATLLMAGMSAEAKKEKGQGQKGKPTKEMKQAEGKAKADAQTTETKAKGKSEEAQSKGKGKSEEAKAKEKKGSEEMKKATAEKKEAQKEAKESGEKMGKEKKSRWKFWKR